MLGRVAILTAATRVFKSGGETQDCKEDGPAGVDASAPAR
jgi:hypothetical protein